VSKAGLASLSNRLASVLSLSYRCERLRLGDRIAAAFFRWGPSVALHQKILMEPARPSKRRRILWVGVASDEVKKDRSSRNKTDSEINISKLIGVKNPSPKNSKT
jgi:hypothetical protein